MSFPKLNECLGNKDENQYKKIIILHALKNSFVRNTITQSSPQKITPTSSDLKLNFSIPKYEQKLSNDQFTDDDLIKLLKHLFNKQNYDLSDRNFIRRILLRYFNQQLICAGGREFVKYLRFEAFKKNQSIQINDGSIKKFYFILRGKVNIKIKGYEYKKNSKTHFGELQILGNQKITEIKAKSDTILLTLKEQQFNVYFAKYFISKYDIIKKRNTLIENILSLTSLYNQYLILSKMYEISYKTGQKIIQKGDPISYIVFLDHTQISFTENKLLNQYKAVGLTEFIEMDEPIAKQTIYCMENKTVLTIKVEDFQQLISKQTLLEYHSAYFIAAKNIIENKAKKQNNALKLENFVRVKKVRFNQKNRMLTLPNNNTSLISPKKFLNNNPEFMTSFVFLKQKDQIKSKNPVRNIDDKRRQFTSKDSFQKKKWLDDFQQYKKNNQQLGIYSVDKKKTYFSQTKNELDEIRIL